MNSLVVAKNSKKALILFNATGGFGVKTGKTVISKSNMVIRLVWKLSFDFIVLYYKVGGLSKVQMRSAVTKTGQLSGTTLFWMVDRLIGKLHTNTIRYF